MESRDRATIILIDNSPTSINGDFITDRLNAQTTCAERLAKNYNQSNQNSQVGIITMSRPEFGIRSSPTTKPNNIANSIPNIKRGKEPIDILLGVKSAILALKNCIPIPSEKRILIFVSSDCLMTDEIAATIRALSIKNNVIIDIVVMGEHVKIVDKLHSINDQIPGSTFLFIKSCNTLVSDLVIAKGIGMKKEEIPQINSKLQHQDPELYKAILASKPVDSENAFLSENSYPPEKTRKSPSAKASPKDSKKKKKK
ncbi:26S proteasome regulatory subunit S5-related protein [Trichomonas vaginalis G3]|uniref:26S proteasome regulatory subunit S5-related protein n=1 Tax=Trichomonas vaginalis (strain ATCC PRA-98 / G3) TaxID=412133 RepID=A2EQF8_TRIV3|nr:proteasome assembly [Trichomonas vaginalis G3]EAY05100.1 26S proteasome regulatory subunit S5-related protein [Trichomonas vaginalis G3]KAI5551470.1 proteasome assembly [Trichomonas vaginalis G3]|eukprot:XP_001317323.1 26S proteasome regulatory subunit S5-related protein [Trichomonas vaginalis G3]